MADDRATLLGETGEVQHAGALALQVGRHGDQGTHGNDAGTADAPHQQVEVTVQVRESRRIQRGGALLELLAGGLHALAAQLAAGHRHKAGAETFHTGVILVAGGLVDLALAPQLGVHWVDGQAVGLAGAVATALADPLVDEDALVRVRVGALLA